MYRVPIRKSPWGLGGWVGGGGFDFAHSTPCAEIPPRRRNSSACQARRLRCRYQLPVLGRTGPASNRPGLKLDCCFASRLSPDRAQRPRGLRQ
jgi:hypothetical protein